MVSLDLGLVVAASRIDRLAAAAQRAGMKAEQFEHSINLSLKGSDLRVQLQTDPRYQEFITRAELREVLGYDMKVACLDDVLSGTIWAHSDSSRRPSKRQKDLADILRLVETHPQLADRLPASIRERMV